jgi:hypothetical protein
MRLIRKAGYEKELLKSNHYLKFKGLWGREEMLNPFIKVHFIVQPIKEAAISLELVNRREE